ncbi:MAG: ABC transporter ATP-binding protein [Polycyclovorans sp.]|jgi:oligopeptide transport system ATP-binding protein|nr:ABC transporter ATP-binding protein [Polycyclovorans sp.]|tara:strand:- start:244 stop:1209 length:966 start_codon:yes stop_codon:yes gene_type:complete
MSVLLDVDHLSVRFRTRDGDVEAVNDLSFTLHAGETLGIVGESGSGKSQTAMAIMGLLADNARTRGRIVFDGQDLLTLPERKRRKIRGARIGMVFQDPMTSLNPYLRIGLQMAEVLETHRDLQRDAALAESQRMLEAVQLADAKQKLRAYPHELSGGQRQRVMVAMTLLTQPALLLADEPTTALDVTVQANLLALLADLRRDMGVAIVLITHDLGVVAQVCDRTLVLYGGQSMELGPTASVIGQPIHPYTQGLLAARPRWEGDRTAPLAALPGHPPDLADLPQGCPFAARCPEAQAHCVQRRSLLRNVGDRVVACHLRGQD